MLKIYVFLALLSASGWVTEASDAGVPFISDANGTELKNRSYDYIVVGGGTAGCAIAATLSRRYKVLVLERGGARLNKRLVEESYAWVEDVVAFRPRNFSAFQSSVRNALLEVGVRPDFGFTYRYVIGTKTTGTIFDSQGRRHPSSDLLLAYAKWKNIEVLLHATVYKVLIQGGRSRGVLYTDSSGRSRTALLSSDSRSEVIISAGALGSPQLLMLSGLGPSAHLQTMGIDVVLDLPLVGKGMGDNPVNNIFLLSRIPTGSLNQQVVGVSTSNFSSGGYGTSPNSGAIFDEVNGPLSTGELFLLNTNASQTPRVRFNYFQNPVDLQRCIAGVNTLEEMVLSRSMSRLVFGNQSLPSGGTVSSPDRRNSTFVASGVVNSTISEFCKQTVGTNYHYHGGCRLGEVVDWSFRVKGLEGIRVVDGSTFNSTPGTNPQATVMMLGRYMGVQILDSR